MNLSHAPLEGGTRQVALPVRVAGAGGGNAGTELRIEALRIRASRIAIPGAWPHRVGIPDLALRREADGGTRVAGDIVLAGQPFEIVAELGAWDGATLPALRGSLAAPGMRLDVAGKVPRSAGEGGWSLALKAAAQAPGLLLAWLAPGSLAER